MTALHRCSLEGFLRSASLSLSLSLFLVSLIFLTLVDGFECVSLVGFVCVCVCVRMSVFACVIRSYVACTITSTLGIGLAVITVVWRAPFNRNWVRVHIAVHLAFCLRLRCALWTGSCSWLPIGPAGTCWHAHHIGIIHWSLCGNYRLPCTRMRTV
jgi:hypothetical protein